MVRSLTARAGCRCPGPQRAAQPSQGAGARSLPALKHDVVDQPDRRKLQRREHHYAILKFIDPVQGDRIDGVKVAECHGNFDAVEHGPTPAQPLGRRPLTGGEAGLYLTQRLVEPRCTAPLRHGEIDVTAAHGEPVRLPSGPYPDHIDTQRVIHGRSGSD